LQVPLAIALSLVSFCALAQEPGKSVSGPLAEFNTAITSVMKTPVVINSKGKKTESFCKRPDPLGEDEIRKLQLSCEKIFNDTAVPEIQRVAAKYILGKTKTQYNARDHATRYCDEAAPLLSAVADFYDQKNIPGNGPHEAIASCLISTERYEPALAWIERGIKRKETAQIQYLAGIVWQMLNESALARNAFERSLALDANHEATKKSLAQIEALDEQPQQADQTTEPSEDTSANNNNECQTWTAAIISNRKVCDTLMEKSFDEFFACMDVGMTLSGYGPRSDEQTQQFYQICGLSSWTDDSLKPEQVPDK
jgi:hypothetical protein